MADLKWFADNLPSDGTAQIVDLTSAWCTLGIWGPRARGAGATAYRWAARVIAEDVGARDRQHRHCTDYPITHLHSNLSPSKGGSIC